MAEEYTVSDSKTGKPEHYQDQDVIETSVNTDGRNQYDWESRYPENARKEMKSEAIYIGIILFVSFVLLICIWCGLIGRIGGHIGLESKIVTSLEGIILYFFSGLMGGTIFPFKKFYRFSDYLGTTSQMSELLGISSISGILRFGRYPAYHGISEPHLAVKSSKSVVENRPYY